MDPIAEMEHWLKKWTSYCERVALEEATHFTPSDEPTQVGAAVCLWAEMESGEIASALYVWTPAEADGLLGSGILTEVMTDQVAAYRRVIDATATRRHDPVRYLTYAVYSPLDLLMQG